jgi:hypothetical protein
MAEEFHNIAIVRSALNGLDFIAEHPLMSGKDSALFVLFERDLFLHNFMVDRFAARSKKRMFVVIP